MQEFPQLSRLGRPLIVDSYDPFPIENLELHRTRPVDEQSAISKSDFGVLDGLLRAGDFFICGSERQRAFWLGMLAANGRINPQTYRDDPSFRRLIDVVPMGIPDSAPAADAGRIKGVFPGIDPSDFLLIWPGGVWDWLDPLTAVEAVHLVAAEAPDVKLFFPGLRHPHPERIGRMDVAARVLQRSKELGLLGRRVFYVDWTPYAERGGYLCDADLALSLHPGALEAHLAIRARLLDCIWGEIPVISTEGDVIADTMAERGLAILVRPGDPGAVAEAILAWRSARESRSVMTARFRGLAAQYRWSTVCQPLAEYLRQHRYAPDRAVEQDAPVPSIHPALPVAAPSTSRRWQTDDILSLPFDQYQRHRQAAEIIEALRAAPGEALKILDVGGGPAVTQRFVAPDDRVVSLDLTPHPGPLSLAADATQLPFAEETFDVVVTLDTIEHLAAHKRLRMIDECVRVARRGFILIAPVASPEADIAENLLFEFIRLVLGAEHEQLREHLQNGLPALGILEAHVRELGYPYFIRPSGYTHRWLAMMLLKHYVLSLPQSESLHRQIDAYYNRYYYEADQCAPSYRALIVVAKSGGAPAVERARQALSAVIDTVPSNAGEAQALGQLSLLVQLFGLKARSVGGGSHQPGHPGPEMDPSLSDQVRALQQALEDTRQRFQTQEAGLIAAGARDRENTERTSREREAELTQAFGQALAEMQARLEGREAELFAAYDLLDRIGRGKVMRLMNAFHSFASRRGD